MLSKEAAQQPIAKRFRQSIAEVACQHGARQVAVEHKNAYRLSVPDDSKDGFARATLSAIGRNHEFSLHSPPTLSVLPVIDSHRKSGRSDTVQHTFRHNV
jgi:hypothetical protein